MTASTKVTYQGRRLNALTVEIITAAEILLGYPKGSLTILQGSYNTGVSASAGTHNGGGAVDITAADWKKKEKVFRLLGCAAWHRPALSGVWAEHVHFIVDYDNTASSGARSQVVDYHSRRNGLANNGGDQGYHMAVFPKFVFGATKQRWVAIRATQGYSQPIAATKYKRLTTKRRKGYIWAKPNVAQVSVGGVRWLVTSSGTFYKRDDFVKYVKPKPKPVVVVKPPVVVPKPVPVVVVVAPKPAAAAAAAAVTGVVTPVVVVDKMLASNYSLGAKGTHITWLGDRLISHGFNKHFTDTKYVPGPLFTEIDRLNVQDFQKAQGWTGVDITGIPNKQTLVLLAASPVKPREILNVSSIGLNGAAYDVKKGAANRMSRIKPIAALVSKKNPMWIHFQEISIDMLTEMDAALPNYLRVPQGGKGRESYYRKDAGITILGAELQNVKHMLKADTKEFLLTAWEKNGFKGLEVTFHNENEGTTFQKAQMKDVLDAALVFAVKYGVPHENILVVGDSNRKETAVDALAWGWMDGGSNAPNSVSEEFHSTNNWTGKTLGRRIDVDLVLRDAVLKSYEQILTPIVSDHFAHYLVRSLLK